MSDRILDVRDVSVHFDSVHGLVKAVDGVSFHIRRGEVFGLVGESGSGKTLAALSVLGLVQQPGRIVSGSVVYGGEDLLSAPEEKIRSIRGAEIAMVFQEPSAAFNPVMTVGYQVAEAIMAHHAPGKGVAAKRAKEYLKRVHIADPERVYHCYPHQLSGGTKQRAMIAMALVNDPRLIILDEPTTALDVTVQAQILDLIEEVIDRTRMSVLFISHDLGVIARMCDRVAVMRKGRIVEEGDKEQILRKPREEYTKSLLDAVKELA